MNARMLLHQIGVDDVTADSIISYLFMAPAQCDGDMPQIILLIEALQNTLNELGARLVVDGDLRGNTVVELRKIIGRDWPSTPFHEIVQRVVEFRDRGGRLKPGLPSAGRQTAVGFIPVPTIPAPLAWGFAGLAAYLLYTRKKGR